VIDKKRVIIFGLILMLLALPLFAKGAEEPSVLPEDVIEDVIKIGVFEPLSGAYVTGGTLELEGIHFAQSFFPTVELGEKTYRIELVVADNQSDNRESAQAVSRLIEQEKVSLILGSWSSSLSMAGGEVAKNAGVPVIGLNCTNPQVTLGNDYYFRVCFVDTHLGTVMAAYAYRNRNARTAVILQEARSDYSQGLTQYFTDHFTGLAQDDQAILSVLSYEAGDRDFSAQIDAVAALNPDVVFVPGNYTESALIIRQARERGLQVAFIGGDAWETPEFLELGGETVEGAVFPSSYASEFVVSPEARFFVRHYRDQNRREPMAATAMGYDGYLLALDALRRAGSTDPRRIRDALADTRDFSGVAGTITLDANGDADKRVFVKTVKKGSFFYEAFLDL
jgi:branched-chain amino acid transport system substrate-binding protein